MAPSLHQPTKKGSDPGPCFKCGKEGHWAHSCLKPRPPPGPCPSTGIKGHWIALGNRTSPPGPKQFSDPALKSLLRLGTETLEVPRAPGPDSHHLYGAQGNCCTGRCRLKKDVQLESCELCFIWSKMRTAAQEAASQIGLREDCSQVAVGERQFIRFRGSSSSSSAEVQPRLIQGVRSGGGVSEDQDTIASIRY